MRKRFRTIWLVLICISALATVNSAKADLKATNVVYAWDRTALRYQNSNVIIYWDGLWVPFLHQLDFDNDLFTPTSPACPGPNTSTRYAGRMEFGLYHTDNSPAGAKGFQETRNWELINCDRDGNGSFSNADLRFAPATSRTTLAVLSPISRDIVRSCSTGNCQDEIVTTLEVNLDTNCDGTIDVGSLDMVCFYAESRVPTLADGPPYWGQQLQARVSVGGGDKTVNFNPSGPTAINLVKLAATSGSDEFRNTILWAGIFCMLLISLAATSLYWRKKQV